MLTTLTRPISPEGGTPSSRPSPRRSRVASTPLAAAAALVIGSAACHVAVPRPDAPRAGAHASPSIIAEPPPAVRVPPPAEAILSDQAIGSGRREGRDHLSPAEAASREPDQAAALREFLSWGWLDGATRSWSTSDEVLVVTANSGGASRAFKYWLQQTEEAPYSPHSCAADVAAGLDDCARGVSGERALVIGRVGSAVFRISCPSGSADRLVGAQVASLAAAVR
jgi:hypothetical protein